MHHFAFRALFVFLVTTNSIQCQKFQFGKGKDVIEVIQNVIKLDAFDKVKDSPLFKKFSQSLPYIGAGFVAFEALDKFLNPQKESPEEETRRELKEISNKLDEISSSISSLNNMMISGFGHLTYELKIKEFKTFSSEIDNFEHQYLLLINTFQETNDLELIERLTKFIEKQLSKSYENKIVVLFDIQVSASQSIVDEIIEFGRKRSKVYEPTMESSTAKIVHDFYMDVLKKILKSYTFREIAINMKHLSTKTDTSKDLELLLNDKKNVLNKFVQSFERASAKLIDGDYKAFINLNPSGDDKSVKFMNVYQTFIGREEDISKDDTCTLTCEDYKYQTYDKDGCQGTLNECWSERKWTDTLLDSSIETAIFSTILNKDRGFSFYQRQEPSVDRIYNVYSYFNSRWKGLPHNESAPTTQIRYHGRGFVVCDICMCYCDQKNHPNTVRWFYIGKQEAPKGYVVTGVRFVMYRRSIFLQIQVGQLLPTSVISKSSLKWLDLADDDKSYVEYSWDKVYTLDLADDIKFESDQTVVTGLQLIVDAGDVVKLQLFGHAIKNITEGTLSSREEKVQGATAKNEFKPGVQVGLQMNVLDRTITKGRKLKFGMSDELTDAMQSYVPYFDANDVTFQTPSPLSSIGLIHYSNNDNFAGYVKPTIKSMHFGMD